MYGIDEGSLDKHSEARELLYLFDAFDYYVTLLIKSFD